MILSRLLLLATIALQVIPFGAGGTLSSTQASKASFKEGHVGRSNKMSEPSEDDLLSMDADEDQVDGSTSCEALEETTVLLSRTVALERAEAEQASTLTELRQAVHELKSLRSAEAAALDSACPVAA
mmetsp:Transcript_66124/g.117643  ORF Transcript_66124/g.117643 Transcript_66124/m.117643 type:complete len:127 (+) Transcript_66124:72-452(+)